MLRQNDTGVRRCRYLRNCFLLTRIRQREAANLLQMIVRLVVSKLVLAASIVLDQRAGPISLIKQLASSIIHSSMNDG